MLSAHIDEKENVLVATSKVSANSGHSFHKGTPREAFIREFLESHLPENVAIGTGEIIDSRSQPGVQRNQFDIVIYKKNYPKLDFGGGISGFLIESVIATVEVKSTITQQELEQAIKASRNAKELKPNFIASISAGYIPPKVLNYVIAYKGPAKIQTVYNWITEIHKALKIEIPNLPLDEDERLNTSSPSIDSIFVLKKGFIYFDNVVGGFIKNHIRKEHPDLKWVYANANNGNLLLFFLMLQTAMANVDGRWLDSMPYLASFNITNLHIGKI